MVLRCAHSVTSYDSVVHDTLKFLLAPSALAFTTLKIKNVEKSSKLSIATSAANNWIKKWAKRKYFLVRAFSASKLGIFMRFCRLSGTFFARPSARVHFSDFDPPPAPRSRYAHEFLFAKMQLLKMLSWLLLFFPLPRHLFYPRVCQTVRLRLRHDGFLVDRLSKDDTQWKAVS